ncbi:MAG: hypothetical protein NTV34_13920, partial [Proteobacteria bacterium]|nr:hypothetical protein [Pseudomonadota bacterium]
SWLARIFDNLGGKGRESAQGVCFVRNPATASVRILDIGELNMRHVAHKHFGAVCPNISVIIGH